MASVDEKYDKYDRLGKSESPWAADDIPKYSTVASSTIEELVTNAESSQIGTVVIFVISAILAITLLFGIAVFIDCRQQKLVKLQKPVRPRRILRLRFPKMGRPPPIPEDEDTFADKMQVPEPSTSTVTV